MGRFVDYATDDRAIPWGGMTEFPESSLADRRARRAIETPDGVERTADLIDSVLALVEDQRVSAGCIRSGKIRPDRKYAAIFLLRKVAGLRPREIATYLGVPRRYARDAIPKGFRVLERLGYAGSLDRLIRPTRKD